MCRLPCANMADGGADGGGLEDRLEDEALGADNCCHSAASSLSALRSNLNEGDAKFVTEAVPLTLVPAKDVSRLEIAAERPSSLMAALA